MIFFKIGSIIYFGYIDLILLKNYEIIMMHVKGLLGGTIFCDLKLPIVGMIRDFFIR